MPDPQYELELVVFEDDQSKIPFNLDSSHDTIWASQQQMAELFGRDVNTISEHLTRIFREGELDEATVSRKFRVTAKDGRNYSVLHYNLDTILSVGYRVSSKKATKFRQWASKILRAYIVDGYALNEARLADDTNALQKLAAQVRKLRSGEKQIYEAVRDCFKISSSDYDSQSAETRNFYATLQDKFLYAITGMTSAQVIMERADHREDFMGLTSTKSGSPTVADATIGKNYLVSDELYGLHILCEQFLLFAESAAVRGKTLTMAALSKAFDELIKVQGHPVFQGYKSALRAVAEKHARKELEAYRQRVRLENTAKTKKLK